MLVWEIAAGPGMLNIADIETLTLELSWNGSDSVEYRWRESDADSWQSLATVPAMVRAGTTNGVGLVGRSQNVLVIDGLALPFLVKLFWNRQ